VRKGLYNFDRITYKIYKDSTAQTEAFKAGEFDYLRTFRAREWVRTYVGKKFDSGELIKAEIPFKNAGDFQGYWINTRREKFKDVRVRQALTYAFDFEWMKAFSHRAISRRRGFPVPTSSGCSSRCGRSFRPRSSMKRSPCRLRRRHRAA
jgi:microcin C transport system substrate-binding protein